MATYAIIDSTTDPLEPGELHAGQTIQISDGDVFIVDGTADGYIIFEAAGGGPASFDVVFNDTNTNPLEVTVGSNLTPTLTVADNAELDNVSIDAVAADALTMDIGDNSSLGKFDGSNTGADVITIGNNFTTTQGRKTTCGDNSITVGDNASFGNLETGIGDDTIVFGNAATIADFDAETGNDTLVFGDDLVAGKIKGGDGNDNITTEAFAPAKSLTKLPGIRHMKGKRDITWVHFACDRHEVVTANGCLSESLLIGPMVVNGLTAPERQVVIDIFGSAPMPDAALNGPPARECLMVGPVLRQLAKCSEAQRKNAAKEINKWDVGVAMAQYEAEGLRAAEARNQIRMKSVA